MTRHVDRTRRRRWLEMVAQERELTNGDVRVMVASASFSDDALKPCFPSAATVARRSHCSVPTVKRGWAKGVQLEYLSRYERKRRVGDGRNRHLQGSSAMYFEFPNKAGNDTASDQDVCQESAGLTPDHSRRITGDTQNPLRVLGTAGKASAPDGASPPALKALEPELEPAAPIAEQNALRADLYQWRMSHPERRLELDEMMPWEWPENSDQWTASQIAEIRDFMENV